MSTLTQPLPVLSLRKGDKVLYQFQEVAIERVEDDRVTSIRDAHFSTSGTNLKVWPVTLEGQVIAAWFGATYDSLYVASEGVNLNWPQIKGYLNEAFDKAMGFLGDGKLIRNPGVDEVLAETTNFVNAVHRQLQQMLSMNAYGIPLLRRK